MKDGRPVALITGANGFIGRHVAPVLERNGWIVRRAVRKARGGAPDELILPVGPNTDWDEALAGVDAIVHLAARVHHKHDEHAVERYRDVNVEGTLHLARSAARAGVGQFVFISTVLVHGRSSDGRAPFSESDEMTPRGLYGNSKAAAEAGLKSLAQSSQMKVSVIRPPLVYGDGAKGNFAMLEKAVRLGLPLPFAGISNRRAFLSVENLADFVRHRLSNPGRDFDVFLLADQEQVSTPEFIRRLAGAAGRPCRLFPLPAPLLNLLLAATGRREMGESLLGSLQLDLGKAASTGWRPPVTLDEGLRLAERAVSPYPKGSGAAKRL